MSKQNEIQTKSIAFKAETIATDGTFTGYLSVFDVEDSYGDVVVKGAFAETIKAWTDKDKMPPILWQHNRNEPIGVWEEMKEDDHGLLCTGRLLIDDVAKAKEAYALMKAKAIDGLSIGYRVKKGRWDLDNQVYQLLNLDLKEGSVVTFPANDETRIDEVKSCLEKGDIPTETQFEKLLTDAGFTKSQTEMIICNGFKSLQVKDDSTSESIINNVLTILNT